MMRILRWLKFYFITEPHILADRQYRVLKILNDALMEQARKEAEAKCRTER